MKSRPVQMLLSASAFLLAFVLLFFFRARDDNRLFSWVWMFSRTDGSLIYLLLIAALTGAFFLARRPFSERYDVLLLAVLPFAAVIPFWGEPELIVDASRYFTQAKHLAQYGVVFFLKEWGRGIFAWTDLPLVPFCYGILFGLFGESRMVIQVFTSLLFSLTVVLTYRIGRMLWDRETGLAAGLLLLGIPYLLTQVPLMLVDVPTMFLLMLSLAAFLDALDRSGLMRAVRAAGAVALFALAKYSAWPMVSLHVVVLAVWTITRDRTGERRSRERGARILAAAAAVTGAVLFAWHDRVASQLQLLREYQGPGLGRWGEGHVSTFLFQVHPFITLFALASAVIAVRKRDLMYAVIVWLVLLVVVFNIQRIRYILPAFPLLALMAAYGLQAVKQDDLRRFMVAGIVAASLVLAFAVYLPFARGMSTVNLKHAGEYLDGSGERDVEVIAMPSRDHAVGPVVSVALLDLFTGSQLRYSTLVPETVPPRRDFERSPLRFTWEFPVPSYYQGASPSGARRTIVMLTDGREGKVPAPIERHLKGYRQSAAFREDDGIFLYSPAVLIYKKNGSKP